MLPRGFRRFIKLSFIGYDMIDNRNAAEYEADNNMQNDANNNDLYQHGIDAALGSRGEHIKLNFLGLE